MSRTPETLTAAQRARLLKLPDQSGSNPSASTMSSKKEQATLERALANFGVQAQPRNASANLKPDEDGSLTVLPIAEIEPYKHNPRTSLNPRYEEIKASIKADGITNMLTVTRRDKHSRYTTYGGGNTRLMIAKELFAEGDQRFAMLQVVVKAWPGDAQIITAHLVENENRGDITFWEKAQGVHQFRCEFEKECGKPVSSSDLHAELKKRGLGYGIKTIQNFNFCIEYLRPIGRWLTATEVNEVIRPSYSDLELLAKKFGQATQAKQAFLQVLQQHGDRLNEATRKRQEDDHEGPRITLDTQALLVDLRSALARTLAVDEERLRIMQAALAANTRISAEDLKALPVIPEAAPASLSYAAVVPPVSSTATARQHRSPSPKRKQPEQPRLQGMLMSAPAPQPQTAAAEPSLMVGLLDSIRLLIEQINSVVPLHDVMLQSPGMPFGYMTDFPRDMAMVDGQPVPRPQLRAAVWKFLTALSGQLDARLRGHLPLASQGVSWSRELMQDPPAFSKAWQACGVPVDEAVMPQMALGELAMIFADPDLGGLMLQLLDKLEQLRTAEPDRAPDGFQPLFE